MEFRFEANISAWDLWKLSMRHIYRSIVGLCNIIFSVAIILLTIKFWSEMSSVLQSTLVLCCVLFPIVQPVMIYMRAREQVKTLPRNMVMEVNGAGICVSGEESETYVLWKNVRGIIKEKNMLILAVEAGRGYMLTNKVLGEQKQAFLEFVESKVKNKK